MNKLAYLTLIALMAGACTSNPSNTTIESPTDTTVVAMDTPYDNDRGAPPYVDAVDQYMRGLNESDLEMILSLYADDATVEDPVGGRVVSGIDSLRAFYTGAVNIDLKVERTGPVHIAGMEAAFPFELKMHINGEYTLTDVIDVFRFDQEGKIISMRAYHGPLNRRLIDPGSF